MLASKQLRQVMRPNGDDERSSSSNQVRRETPKQQKEKDPEDNLVASSAEILSPKLQRCRGLQEKKLLCEPSFKSSR